ncbi:hypothetical protein FHS43_006398 [Streptosporangium becharense]|uniref:DUF732 domain-containing protein n=1 Tax=Streptosporangium becharense TaxID=1816182 RepID=A0A7W9MJA6_9ACTN|nr:DUF732 domain-containing protein [Streptosporangium becharense]MBB2915078.1 hypothetical protein [Streptosporangium becharense]MBB5822850.1 hypothetical protein [Streptosporangium becharense]
MHPPQEPQQWPGRQDQPTRQFPQAGQPHQPYGQPTHQFPQGGQPHQPYGQPTQAYPQAGPHYQQGGPPQGWQQPPLGPPPGWPQGPPQPPKKRGFGLAVAGGVLLVLALVGGGVVLLNGEDAGASRPTVAKPSTSAGAGQDERTAEPTEPTEPTAEPTGEPTAGSVPEQSLQPSTPPTTQPTTQPSETAGSGNQKGQEALFIAALRQNNALRNIPSVKLIQIGKQMCASLDGGSSLTDVATSGAGGLELESAAYVAGAAIVTLCPRHRDKIPN